MSLQNHIGDVEFPVRSRSRYAKIVEARRRATPRDQALRALLTMLCGLTVATILFSIAFATEVVDPFFAGAAGFVVTLITAAGLLARWDAGAMRRAQRAYLEATGASPITLEQQQILALDAASDYSFGGWNSSLSFAFAWIELPAPLRATWADGQKGTPWPALPYTSLSKLRTTLDDNYKIASALDAEVLVADLLAKGRLSARFEAVADSPDADVMASRVAALTGRTVFDVLELSQAVDGREPELLLAGDVERVIGGVRYAYMTGYLTAERAWELLRQVADKAFERYDSYDEYWDSLAFATAFRTDSLESVEAHRANVAGLRENGWPAASTPYPRRSRTTDPTEDA
ncbi:DUF1266 domain-containing protein [Microbacterium sp. P07]|uniref:DUF1266 domain-containing protein n=1 Tax=Microbacterium sp. P07 TaxID=3366952 RepID=UPI003745F2FB